MENIHKKKRKSKKVSKSKRRASVKKGSKENRILIYGLAAAIALAFIVMAFPGGNQKKDVKNKVTLQSILD